MANNTRPLNTIVSTINTLTRSTYEQWCFKCKIELGKTLYDLVTGATDPPDENDGEATLSAWEVVNREAMRILIRARVSAHQELRFRRWDLERSQSKFRRYFHASTMQHIWATNLPQIYAR